MSILAPAELASYLRTDPAAVGLQAALDAGEGLVLAELGVDTLAATTRSQTTTLPRDRRSIELRFGPLAALTALTVDGASVDLSNVQTSPWLVARSEGFRRGQTVGLTYTSGFAAASLPSALKQALLIAAAGVFNAPDGSVTRQQAGDEAVTRVTWEALPPQAKALCRAYRRPLL